MKKFEGLSLTMALAVAGAMSGCDQNNGWNDAGQASRVCVDQQGMRVREDKCPPLATAGSGGVSPYMWYYLGTLNRGAYAPGYGGTVTGGSFRASPGVSYAEAPAEGGIARGGFGGTGEGFGGAHGAGE